MWKLVSWERATRRDRAVSTRTATVTSALPGQEVVVNVRSSDFDTYLIVESPSGERFVNDDYQGDTQRSLLSLSLNETGEYQILVSSYSSGDSGSYTLHIGRHDTPLDYAARYNGNPAVIEALLAAGAGPGNAD